MAYGLPRVNNKTESSRHHTMIVWRHSTATGLGISVLPDNLDAPIPHPLFFSTESVGCPSDLLFPHPSVVITQRVFDIVSRCCVKNLIYPVKYLDPLPTVL